MFLSLVELKSMAGQTGNGSEQKGRSGCVIDHLRETRVPFGSHIQVTRTRKTFQTFANAAVVRRSVLKNRNFCRLGTVWKRYGANLAPLSSQNQ